MDRKLKDKEFVRSFFLARCGGRKGGWAWMESQIFKHIRKNRVYFHYRLCYIKYDTKRIMKVLFMYGIDYNVYYYIQ